MKLRAIARATDRSNAIGAVELLCAPQGLLLTYLGTASWGEGYAPGALTHGTLITVPYMALLDARVDGDQVYLSIDPELTPLNRLVLTDFSAGNSVHPREKLKRDRMIWITSLVGAVVISILGALTLPKLAPRVGAGATLLAACLGGGVVLLLGFITSRLFDRSPSSGFLREAFASELARYVPKLQKTDAAPAPKPKPELIPSFGVLIPRTTAGIVITLSACALGAVLTGSYVLKSERNANTLPPVAAAPAPPPKQTLAESQLVDDAVPVEPAASAALPPEPAQPTADEAKQAAVGSLRSGSSCSCARSDSLLWSEAIPKLSLIAFNRRTVTRGTRDLTQLDVAAVNNSDEELRELSLNLQFYKVANDGKKSLGDHRAVYYQGPLGPGEAIKWAIEAEGTVFELLNPVEGTIAPNGEGAAPPNAIAELLKANNRPVRLHGAMLLAYLGDSRAHKAASDLREALREDEAPYLDRLLKATSELRVCQLQVVGSGSPREVQACVYNASKELKDNIGVKLRALSAGVHPENPVAPPPLIDTERVYGVDKSLPPETGVVLRGSMPVEDASKPLAFEAWADRIDLLR
ncbi:MAG: hypothetical protein AB7K71_05060 [Polyangiaceae bacterium]